MALWVGLVSWLCEPAVWVGCVLLAVCYWLSFWLSFWLCEWIPSSYSQLTHALPTHSHISNSFIQPTHTAKVLNITKNTNKITKLKTHSQLKQPKTHNQNHTVKITQSKLCSQKLHIQINIAKNYTVNITQPKNI